MSGRYLWTRNAKSQGRDGSAHSQCRCHPFSPDLRRRQAAWHTLSAERRARKSGCANLRAAGTFARRETAEIGLGPAISPDGSKVAYPVKEGPVESVYAVPASGGVPQRLCTQCRTADGFSPDGNQMMFWAGAPGPASIGLLDLASGQKQIILKRPGYAVYRSRFSRDGRWMAFHARNRPGRSAIFVAPFGGLQPSPSRIGLRLPMASHTISGLAGPRTARSYTSSRNETDFAVCGRNGWIGHETSGGRALCDSAFSRCHPVDDASHHELARIVGGHRQVGFQCG